MTKAKKPWRREVTEGRRSAVLERLSKPILLTLQPISFREACEFIRKLHRHHKPPQGWLFGVAVNDGEKIVGVATIGRPVARMLQDGFTAEVTRCCTDDTPHVASKLYGAAWRAARALGYRRLITYTLAVEKGTSVQAAGWREVGKAGGGQWSRPSRLRVETEQPGQKTLWERGSRGDERQTHRC